MAKKEKKKKSLFRRIMKWTGIGFLVLLLILILIPVIFKDKIQKIAVEEVNKMLLADFNFEDFDLTFISTFPEMTVRFDGVTVTGRDKFKGVKLADIKRFDAHVTCELCPEFWEQVNRHVVGKLPFYA